MVVVVVVVVVVGGGGGQSHDEPVYGGDEGPLIQPCQNDSKGLMEDILSYLTVFIVFT